MDGLLTETELSIDGNWMVYCCKLFMEWVQSIYGNSPADIDFGAWKYHFFRDPKPTFRGTPRIHQLIYCILEAFFTESWNTAFKSTKLRVSKFSAFWQSATAEKAFECDSKFNMERRSTLSSMTRETETEIKRSIYENWMFSWPVLVCWRKLDGLLTDTVRPIDGNWMKIVQSIYGNSPSVFLILGAWKRDYCRVLKLTLSWTPSILHLIFSSLEARKSDFGRVVKTRDQWYQDSCEQILTILVAIKRWFQASGKIEFPGLIPKKISTSKQGI